MLKIVLLFVAIILTGYAVCAASMETDQRLYSDIKPDEDVVFFRTAARLDEANQEWHLPIHGWIYEPEDSVARKTVFAAILKSKYELEPAEETEANFTRRLNLMIADNERGKQIVIALAGQDYTLPTSGVNGHFETMLVVPVTHVEEFVDDSVLSYSAVTRKSETRQFTGEVLLTAPTGLSIISDIDDTVKISNVNDHKSLLEHTFLLDFSAAPGMAQLYDKWSKHDASFHYVSSSPWQLYSPLREFLDESEFPRSTLSLKAVRFRDKTLIDLFKKGTETKPVAIEKILNAYSGRQFILVGDSGEQDPEVYASLLRKYPDQIQKIYIRNVTQESADNERFESVFENVEQDCWVLFDDPMSLQLPELRDD